MIAQTPHKEEFASEAEIKAQTAELVIRALACMSRLPEERQAASKLYSMLNLALGCAAQESAEAAQSIKANGLTAVDVAPTKAAEVTHEPSEGDKHAMTLAKAIREAGLKAGIIHEGAVLTGTNLLMILDELVSAVGHAATHRSPSLH